MRRYVSDTEQVNRVGRAKALKEARRTYEQHTREKISQQQMATICKCTQVTISRLMRGDSCYIEGRRVYGILMDYLSFVSL